jgi:hypothetical protein
MVPPTDYCGGWACFFIALGVIGLVTALIGDLASLFGCVMGLEDEITAITFVALGTSLPDAFASKTAAVNDDNADACKFRDATVWGWSSHGNAHSPPHPIFRAILDMSSHRECNR